MDWAFVNLFQSKPQEKGYSGNCTTMARALLAVLADGTVGSTGKVLLRDPVGVRDAVG